MFGYKRGDFPVAEEISDKTIALPFYNNLTEKEIDYVVKNLKECL
jgi:perosamine synthetase